MAGQTYAALLNDMRDGLIPQDLEFQQLQQLMAMPAGQRTAALQAAGLTADEIKAFSVWGPQAIAMKGPQSGSLLGQIGGVIGEVLGGTAHQVSRTLGAGTPIPGEDISAIATSTPGTPSQSSSATPSPNPQPTVAGSAGQPTDVIDTSKPPAPSADNTGLAYTQAQLQAWLAHYGENPNLPLSGFPTKFTTAWNKQFPNNWIPQTPADAAMVSDWARTYYYGGDPALGLLPSDPYTHEVLPQGPTPDYTQQNKALLQNTGQFPNGLDAAYQQYLQGFQNARNIRQNDNNVTPLHNQPKPMDQTAWTNHMLDATYGPSVRIVDLLMDLYSKQYLTAMPEPLQQELLKLISNWTTDPANANAVTEMLNVVANIQQQALLPQTGQQTAASAQGGPLRSFFDAASALTTSSGFPELETLISNYHTLNPSAQDVADTAALSVQAQYQQLLHRSPTADEYAAAKGKSDAEVKAQIENTTLPNGMKLGAYTAGMSRLTTNFKWDQYFGQNPTDSQVQMFAGWSDSDISNWISGQKSHVPGMTIGQYEGYSNSVDAMANKYFGYSSSQFLHDLVNSRDAGTSTPQNLPAYTGNKP